MPSEDDELVARLEAALDIVDARARDAEEQAERAEEEARRATDGATLRACRR